METGWERLLRGLDLIFNPETGFYQLLLDGLQVTLIVTFFAAIFGTVLGVIVALCRLSSIKPLNWLAGIYITVIRGTPVTIQLMIIWFSILTSVDNRMLVGCIAFGINSGAYVAEIIRAGILAVDRGQAEAGRTLGLNHWQTLMYIIFPQAVKNALPPLGSEFIVLIKETSVLGFVGLIDLTRAANMIRGATYNTAALYVAAAIYLLLVMAFTWLLGKLERRLRRSDHR